MAANSSGHRFTDQVNAEKIYYLAQEFALKYLAPKGNFVCKFFRNSLEKNDKKDFDKAAEDLRLATRHLSMIVGKVDVEEILGSIFNDFCIGK